MALQVQNKNSAGSGEITLLVEFIAICVLVFIASVSATAYFCRSMCGGMKMPGNWTMSMMWMRMPGETWFVSALSFMLMWLSMMVAMMMLSALPMFLKTRKKWRSLYYMASGYFAIWLLAGVGIYALGVAFAMAAMWSQFLSHAVPLLSATSLMAAGAVQFTRLKLTHILHCRSALGCASSGPQAETSFWLGCKQGAACCLSCIGPMTIQLAFGLMNPAVMILVGILIAMEKLLPQPDVTTRLVGIAAFFAAFTIMV